MLFSVTIIVLLSSFAQASGKKDGDTKNKISLDDQSKKFKAALKRGKLIESSLKKDPATIIVSVDGLCCKTCAIGIGKKVSKVAAVDLKKLPKGISLDRKNGLLTVAIKKDAKIEMSKLTEAIRKAGYKPTNVYQLGEDGKVSKTAILPKQKSKK